MNHMSVGGNVSQHMRYDYGEFLTSGNLRLRTDLITAYMCHFDKEANKKTGVKFLVSGGWLIADHDGDEACDKEIQRIDWIFRGEERKTKETTTVSDLKMEE